MAAATGLVADSTFWPFPPATAKALINNNFPSRVAAPLGVASGGHRHALQRKRFSKAMKARRSTSCGRMLAAVAPSHW
jgi:hypothetical protein